MQKIIIFLFLVILNLQAYNTYDLTLKDFADRVSKSNNIIIYLDENLDKQVVSVFIPGKIKPKELLNLFKQTIKKNKYKLVNTNNIYFLTKRVNFEDKKYLYKLKYSSYKDCIDMLTLLNVKFKYLEDLNALLIISNDKRYPQIKKYIEDIDTLQNQVMLKIMIFEHTDQDLKEIGVQYGSIYKDISGTVKNALNAIIFPINTNNPLLSTSSFYSAVKLLNEINIINVKQFPYILVKNNKSFKFEAVENIPYLISSTTTQATNTSEQNTIEYKDIGLKINGKTSIHHDFITLDLDLVIEDIINGSESDNMPRTYKRTLKSNTNIDFNKVLLLSGIKRTKNIYTEYKIPFISNLYFIGDLFKYKSHNVQNVNITIAIEVIKKNERNLEPFSLRVSSKKEALK